MLSGAAATEFCRIFPRADLKATSTAFCCKLEIFKFFIHTKIKTNHYQD